MASIEKVYRPVKNLANNEQKGFITPAVFNRFAVIAQQNIYNELFTELIEAKKVSRQNVDPGRDKSPRKRTLEDLSNFVVRNHNYTVTLNSDSSDNVFLKPSNFSRMISMAVGGSNARKNSNKVLFEVVYDVEKMDRILGSNLSSPTSDYPVALISQEIEVFPADQSITSIDITYYRTPGGMQNGAFTDSDPQWIGEQFGNQNIELASPSSVDFMLPEHFSSELVYEIAKLIGISINDGAMVQVSTQEEARR